jgi:hypothetical protein
MKALSTNFHLQVVFFYLKRSSEKSPESALYAR